MDIKDLQWFLQLLEAGSFSGAAKKLDITQPTLSRTIQKLEQDLNTQLVIRNSSGIVATSNGLELRRRIEPVLNEVRSIEISMKEESDQGIVRIGATPMTSVMFMAPLITDFSAKHPGIKIYWYESGTEKIRTKLIAGELDLGFGLYSFDDSVLDSVPLISDKMVVYMHEKNPLSQHESLNFNHLRNEKFNICDSTYAVTQQIFSRCTAQNYSPNVNIQSSRVLFLMQLTAQNNGICILPRPYGALFAHEHTKMVPIDGYPWIEAMMMNKNAYISSSVQTAIDYLRSSFAIISEEFTRSDDKNPLKLSCLQNWGK